MTQTLGERLKARRLELNLSMRQAAYSCGVTTSFIHRIETGHVAAANFNGMCRVLIKFGFGEREIYEIVFDMRNNVD